MTLVIDILASCWQMLAEAAPYILFGFFVSGLLKGALPDDLVARHLGGSSFTSVLKASVLGIPLPLCSCGVIPAAIGLRRQGAGRGASAAFLVSTPESGVDSMAITYALLDPVMMVLRPVAALLTAMVTGLVINLLPETGVAAPADDAALADACCADDCCAPPAALRGFPRLKAGVVYAFGELLRDIGGWLLIGIAVAGVIDALIPDDFFLRLGDNELTMLLAMLLVGIPLYICASASTPIAAALILKGISPGAALVFLLAGPATNAATVTLVARFWGKGTTAVYLVSIAACSLLAGWLTDVLYAASGWDIAGQVHAAIEAGPRWWEQAAAVLLLVMILRSFLPKHQPHSDCGCGEPPGGG